MRMPSPRAGGLVFIVLGDEARPLDQTDVTNGGDANPRGVEASGEDWKALEIGLGRPPP